MEEPAPADRLRLTAALFSALDRSGVEYIHWKSNEHLSASLKGETDLDLLVDPDDRGLFLEVIDRLGFVGITPPSERAISGIDGYLGFDEDTGSLLHLDVHYRLILGEQLLKNHHLPIEDWLLSDPSRLEGVKVPRPERELLLLYIRSMLKTTARQLARSVVKGGSPLPERIRREGRWLAGLAGPDDLAAAAESSGLGIGGDEVIEFRSRSLEDHLDWRYVLDRRRSLRRRLRNHQRLPSYAAWPKKTWLRLRTGSVAKRLGLGLPPRHLSRPSPFIAVVGADGSGKSLLGGDLTKWLGRKLVVHHVYFGQPKAGFWFKLLNKPGSMARGHIVEGDQPSLLGTIGHYTDGAKWIALARARRRLARRGREQCRRGEVVIAERFPLAEFHDMAVPMDGPRLQPDGPFAGTERRLYRSIRPPDLTLVLNADVETLRARKVDITFDEHVAKVEAVQRLEPGPGRIVIDAGRPYEEVLLEAKREIWKALHADR